MSVTIHPVDFVFFVVQAGNREDGSSETTAETDGPQQSRGDTFQIAEVTHTESKKQQCVFVVTSLAFIPNICEGR